MSADLVITCVNSSYVSAVSTNRGVVEDIHTYFSFVDPTVYIRPGNKWNGVIHIYAKRSGLLPRGLLPMLMMLVKDRGWAYEIDKAFKEEIDSDLSYEDISKWIAEEVKPTHEDGKIIDVYDYQINAVHQIAKYKRRTILAATSAGKSLIIYCLVRYAMMHPDAKILIVVPTVALVHQLYNDFIQYSHHNKWGVSQEVHTVHAGKAAYTDLPITITTTASIAKQDASYFNDVTDLIIDEAHLASAASFKHICDSCVNARTRAGLTGTLKAEVIHPLIVQSRIGPTIKVVGVKELQESGRAAQTDIVRVRIKHPVAERVALYRCSYAEEIDYVLSCDKRNDVLINFAKNTKGNTLMMFRYKANHLHQIREKVEVACPHKKVFVWSGDESQAEKEAIKLYVESHDDAILLGTEGSISTGISIRNLYNFAFCHPIKSFIKVMQSIGRMIRQHGENKTAMIFDFYDDLSANTWINAGMTHGNGRAEYYRSEGLPYKDITKEL